MVIIRKLPGATGASRAPSRIRVITMGTKLLLKPAPMRTKPQATIAPDMDYAMGRRWRIWDEGKHQKR
jgi:hypothetical protein